MQLWTLEIWCSGRHTSVPSYLSVLLWLCSFFIDLHVKVTVLVDWSQLWNNVGLLLCEHGMKASSPHKTSLHIIQKTHMDTTSTTSGPVHGRSETFSCEGTNKLPDLILFKAPYPVKISIKIFFSWFPRAGLLTPSLLQWGFCGDNIYWEKCDWCWWERTLSNDQEV